MPKETIRYLITGVNNGRTGTVQMEIVNGSGTCSIPMTSSAAGIDTLVAYLDSLSLSSNQAQMVWQGTNGPIATGPINAYTMTGPANTKYGWFPPGLTQASFTGPYVVQGLNFDSPTGTVPGDSHTTNWAANPFVCNTITSAGNYAGDAAVPGTGSGGFLMVLTGDFVVAQAGQIVFTCYSNGGFLLGVGGSGTGSATFVSGAQTIGGNATNTPVTATPFNQYPVLAAFNGPGWTFPGGNYATNTFTLKFSSGGVYPFELCFAAGNSGHRVLTLQAGGVIKPVTMTLPQPSPSPAPAGAKLTLSPLTSSPTIINPAVPPAFTVNAQGLVFPTRPYLPFLEGQSGEVLFVNTPGPNFAFTYPALPNNAAANPQGNPSLTLSGNNGSWQNRMSLSWNGSSYTLTYNGAAVDANVASTVLTINTADIAWYNPVSNLFDCYQPSALGGGSSASIDIYWLVKPTISSYGPQSVPGNGSAQTILFTLAKPLPPLQSNTVGSAIGGTGALVTAVTPVLNSAGWIMGYNVTATIAAVSGTVSSSLVFSLAGTITYLAGTQFVTQAVTYINRQVFPLSFYHNQLQTPVAPAK